MSTTTLIMLAAGSAGVLLGLWFRVPALIGASGVIALIGIAYGLLLNTAVALASLQGGYLLGLLLSKRDR
jgi:hypothetical protein